VQAKRAEKKEQFIATARRLIAEQGIAEASVHELARQLGLSPATLYWYFPSREALIGEVQRRVFHELGDVFASQIADYQRSAREAAAPPRVAALVVLLKLAGFYLELPDTRPEHARMIAFSLDPRVWLDDQQGALLAPVLVRLFREVALPFHTAETLGALRPGTASARAVQYWAALQGLVQTNKLARLSPGLFDARALGLSSAEALLVGWGAEPNELEDARKLAMA
jgi:AcrR family transcriptional regulator